MAYKVIEQNESDGATYRGVLLSNVLTAVRNLQIAAVATLPAEKQDEITPHYLPGMPGLLVRVDVDPMQVRVYTQNTDADPTPLHSMNVDIAGELAQSDRPGLGRAFLDALSALLRFQVSHDMPEERQAAALAALENAAASGLAIIVDLAGDVLAIAACNAVLTWVHIGATLADYDPE